MTGIIPLIQAHEGTTPISQPNSHVAIYLSRVQQETRQKAEGLAAPGDAFDANPVLQQVFNAAVADSKAMDADSRNNLTSQTVPCTFHYDYSRLR